MKVIKKTYLFSFKNFTIISEFFETLHMIKLFETS